MILEIWSSSYQINYKDTLTRARITKHTLHSCAACSVPGFLPTPPSSSPPLPPLPPAPHKQAGMQTNRQADKPCVHTQAVLIRGQTWLKVSLQFCHQGNPAKTNRTASRAAAGAPVNPSRPHTAQSAKVKMSQLLSRCHMQQLAGRELYLCGPPLPVADAVLPFTDN